MHDKYALDQTVSEESRVRGQVKERVRESRTAREQTFDYFSSNAFGILLWMFMIPQTFFGILLWRFVHALLTKTNRRKNEKAQLCQMT